MPNKISVHIDNKVFTGWQNLTISMDMTAFCNSFSFSSPKIGNIDPALLEGKPCQIKIENKVIINGYIDIYKEELNLKDHKVTISGRDKASDLVDCHSIDLPSEFHNLSIEQITKKICEPFGVSCFFDGLNNSQLKLFKVDQGQKIHEILELLGRKFGFLFRSSENGQLTVLNSGKYPSNKTGLTEGKNLKAINFSLNYAKRYSDYIVVAQNFGAGDWSTKKKINITRRSKDLNVTRYRPRVVTANVSLNSNEAQLLADWHNCIARAGSYTINCTTQGWLDSENNVWQPAKLIRVYSERLGLDKELLIKSVTLKLTKSEGSTVDLELTYPDAFIPQPIFKKKNHKGDK